MEQERMKSLLPGSMERKTVVIKEEWVLAYTLGDPLVKANYFEVNYLTEEKGRHTIAALKESQEHGWSTLFTIISFVKRETQYVQYDTSLTI